MQYRKHVLICTREGEGRCGSHGGMELLNAMRKEAAALNLKDVYITKTGCTSQHHLGNTIIVYPEGIWYKGVELSDVQEIVEKHLKGNKPVKRLINENISVKGV